MHHELPLLGWWPPGLPSFELINFVCVCFSFPFVCLEVMLYSFSRSLAVLTCILSLLYRLKLNSIFILLLNKYKDLRTLNQITFFTIYSIFLLFSVSYFSTYKLSILVVLHSQQFSFTHNPHSCLISLLIVPSYTSPLLFFSGNLFLSHSWKIIIQVTEF